MKFALAAGLLTGSLPVASANAADTTLEDAQNFLLRSNVNGAIQRNSQKSIKYCDPNSRDPDVGVLSCGQDRFCLPTEDSVLGGICQSQVSLLNLGPRFRKRGGLKNARAAWRKSFQVECDPKADPDVGILSCDIGETCVPSTFSSMGGLCESDTPGRALQSAEVYLCDPTLPYYQYCDCSGFNNVTGNGVVTCLPYGENTCIGYLYPTGDCGDVCGFVNATYTYVDFANPTYTRCRESTTPYAQVACVDASNVDGTCSVSLNGDPCTSCEIVPNGNYTATSFDCSNVDGGTVGVSIYSFDLLPVVQACANPSQNATDGSCDICNGPLVNPDAVATVLQFSFTCSEFESRLDSTTCSLAAPLLASTCCTASGNETTPAPSASEPSEGASMSPAPTPAPGDGAAPGPGPVGGETMPPSGGSTIFTKSSWLVTLGLAVAWTFGHTH